MSQLRPIPDFPPAVLTRFGTREELVEAFGPQLDASAARQHELGFHMRVLDQMTPDPDTYLTAVSSEGNFVGLVLRTPTHPVVLSDLPDAAVSLVVDDLRRTYDELPSAMGPRRTTEAFARRWAGRRATRSRVDMRTEMFVLDRVAPHEVPSAGKMVAARDLEVAGHEDVAQDLGLWGQAFAQEIGLAGEEPSFACVRERVHQGRMFVWLDESGRPVSTACVAGGGPKGVWISLVYTPPEFRGRGHARALVASLSRDLLAADGNENTRFCFLFADLGNRGARKMYERVGYRPVAQWVKIDFALARKPGLLGLGGTLSLV